MPKATVVDRFVATVQKHTGSRFQVNEQKTTPKVLVANCDNRLYQCSIGEMEVMYSRGNLELFAVQQAAALLLVEPEDLDPRLANEVMLEEMRKAELLEQAGQDATPEAAMAREAKAIDEAYRDRMDHGAIELAPEESVEATRATIDDVPAPKKTKRGRPKKTE